MVAETIRTFTRTGLRAADAFELLLLQDAQQLRLHLGRYLADLVEQQRATIGQLESPDAPLLRSGEGAPLVPEQLTLDQRRRERGAVHPDERPRSSRAELVNRARDELLARSRLTMKQHGGRRRRHPSNLREHRGEPVAAGESRERVVVATGDLATKVVVLGLEAPLKRSDGGEQTRVLDGDRRLVSEEGHARKLGVAQRLTREGGEHPLQSVSKGERPAGERDQSVVSRPGRVGDPVVVGDVVGPHGLSGLGDAADSASPQGYPAVRAVETGRQARAGSQRHRRIPWLHEPHTRQRYAEVFHEPTSDAREDRVELERTRHLERDPIE